MNKTRKYVSSKIINYIEYNPEQQLLCIAFNDGVVIDYSDFPKSKYQEFLQSHSAGKFYLKHIRNKFQQHIKYEY